jgi:hypothetical protein
MGMLASQPVRSENQNLIDLACSRSITQSIELGARQRGTADSDVGEDQIRIELQSGFRGEFLDRGELRIDCSLLCLLIT